MSPKLAQRVAARVGVGRDFGEPKIDLDKLREFKNNVVKRLTERHRSARASSAKGAATSRALAEIVDPHDVRRRAGGRRRGDAAVRARDPRDGVASRRIPPALRVDDPRVMDSTGALDLPDIPKSLLVVGGGYIGLELGSVYAALGSEVTVVEMTPGLLPGADRDLVDVLARRIDADLTKAVLLKTTRHVDEAGAEGHPRRRSRAKARSAREQVFDRVLVVRRPPAELGDSGPRPDARRRSTSAASSMVDEQRRTAEPSIFAIGDVVGEPMLAHKASHEGRVAVEVIAGENVAFAAAGDSGRRVHRSRGRLVRA